MLAAALPAQALEYTWLGGDGLWTTGSNWDLLAVPNAVDSNVTIDGGKAATSNVLLTSEVGIGSLTVNAGDVLNVQGTSLYVHGHQIRVDGRLDFTNLPYKFSNLLLKTNSVTLSGTGQTVFTGSYLQSRGGSTPALTIDVGHTLRGDGLTIGDSGGGVNVINHGVLRAEGSNGIRLHASDRSPAVPGFDNRGGVVEVADGSTLLVDRSNFLGGTIRGEGMAKAAGAFRDVTLEGTVRVGNQSFTAAGTLTNKGTLTVAGSLGLADDLTLAGNGRTVLTAGGSVGSNCCATTTLTIAPDHTLSGYGLVMPRRLVNQGTLIAEGGEMVLWTDNLNNWENQGRFEVAAGAIAGANGNTATVRQTAAGASTFVDGTLDLSTLGLLDLQAGRLEGTGTVIGNVVAGAATIAPGHSPGKLSLNQTLTLGAASTLEIDADGLARGSSYDWLAVGGNTTLAGHVVLDIGNAAQVGDRFSFLTFGGARSGNFIDVTASGYTLALEYGAHDVSAVITGVSAVPEPGTWALWLAGLTTGGAVVRQRRRRGR